MADAVVTTLKLESRQYEAGLKKVESAVAASAKRQESIWKRAAASINTGIFQGVGQALAQNALSMPGRLVNLLGRMATAAADAETAQLRLAAALQATGNTTGWSAEQLATLAEELSTLSSTAVPEIKAGMAAMAMFGNIRGKTFEGAMKAALDLSRLMGNDLVEAARKVGRVLNDPIKGFESLAEQGISFSDKQIKKWKEMLAVGKGVQVQQELLAQIGGKLAGQAQAQRGGIGGSMERIANAIQRIFATAGSGLAKTLESVATTLEKVATLIAASPLAKNIEAMLESLNNPDNLSKVLDFISPLVEGLITVAAALKTFVTNFGTVVSIIPLTIRKVWEDFTNGLRKLYDAVLKEMRMIFRDFLVMYAKVSSVQAPHDPVRILPALGEEPKTAAQQLAEAIKKVGDSFRENRAGPGGLWEQLKRTIKLPDILGGGKGVLARVPDFIARIMQLPQSLMNRFFAKGDPVPVAKPLEFSGEDTPTPKFSGLIEQWKGMQAGFNERDSAANKTAKNTEKAANALERIEGKMDRGQPIANVKAVWQ